MHARRDVKTAPLRGWQVLEDACGCKKPEIITR